MEGEVAQVAGRLRELPWRQLVVIGEPGAGKSVLAAMLVDQLLSQPVAGEAVPVLVGVSSWNPRTESVAVFVARRLVEDYGITPKVARELVERPRLADGSAAGWWVLPVLDGLDEIDPALQPVAVAAIEDFAATDRGVVVTCRVREFRRATAGGVLARAAVVQLQPLASADVIAFLEDPDPRRRLLWQPVFAALRADPGGILGSALSTPLMAGLAKDVYSPRPGMAAAVVPDPGELLHFTTRQQITARLIDGFIATVYDHSPAAHRGRNAARGGGTAESAGSFYPVEDAARWLGNLAYLGYLGGSRDLRWWLLPWEQLALRPYRTGWWQTAGLAGMVLAVVTAVGWVWAGPVRAVAAAALTAVIAVLCYLGTFGWIFTHEFQPRPPVPARLRSLVRRAKTTGIVGWLAQVCFGGLCGAATGVLLSQPLTGLIAGVVAGGAVAALPPAGGRATPAGPAATFRANHLLAVVLIGRHVLAGAFACGGAAALTGTSVTGWVVAAVGCFGVGAFSGAERAWLQFRVTHIVLSTQTAGSMLPRSIDALLTDGTRPERNTIRVNGTAWQFRHAIIQDHLAPTTHTRLLRRRADTGDWSAAEQLAGLLREQGNLDELRRRADTGNRFAAEQLAELLREQGNLDEAIAVLRRHADTGDGPAARQLAGLLREQGNLDEAIAVLRRHADTGDGPAARQLAELLREQGNLDELRRRADTGNLSAARQLAELLREQGKLDELRRRTDTGDWQAARQLAGLLRKQGNLDEAIAVLRRHADTDDWPATGQLAELLREQGNLDEAIAVLRRRADTGDWQAAGQLAGLLREQGNLDELRRRTDTGDWRAAGQLAGLLREQGNLDELRRRADTGNRFAAGQLAELLREQGNLDELRRRTDTGNLSAAGQLAELLREQGNLDEAIAVLRRHADTGNVLAARWLAEMLREQGNLDELRRRADAGDWSAPVQLAGLLREQGNLDELRRRADAGDVFAAGQLAGLLREQGNLDEAIAVLRRRADTGDRSAAEQLAGLLREQGNLDELNP
ncbi:tetratricopeptide repeat protein [Solwaraspora sp. WMMD1047]|uniref:tetratricopeptide repeat protein n=1 Tax=Solwaraspora sp. WMMD1047 TaxID=3016102 RepID=UPI0024177A4C|nr:tetratricopeptide repeat protein [Solwaraspora sp. WMMD1047]MDG4834206.1 tetratricopeptide repeat protein [Solwaraspora sp. WMMD1047]